MYHKTRFMLCTDSYTFWHQGAILMEFTNNKDHKSVADHFSIDVY